MQDKKAEFDKHRVEIVVVSFAEPDRLRSYQEMHRWPFRMLADPEREGYIQFGLKRLPWTRIFTFPTLKLYLELLRKGRKLQNYGKDDYFQSGGDFMLARDGTVLFSYRSHDPADRPSAEKLVQELGRISAEN